MIGRPPAELVERREFLPGRFRITIHAPAVVSGLRAGQFVQLRTGQPPAFVVRRPFAVATADAVSGTLSIHAGAEGFAGAAVGAIRPGDAVELFGPFGRPWEVDPRSRHLLLVAEDDGIAAVRLLADEAIRDGRQVTLLFGAGSARDVYPSTLLPDEVEYVVATRDGSMGRRGSVIDLVPDYEAWADQAFAAGPPDLLAGLARLAATRRARLGVATLGRKRGGGRVDPPGSAGARRRAFLQVALPHGFGCALGTCLGCVVLGVDGAPERVCREGPVFASDELAWSTGS